MKFGDTTVTAVTAVTAVTTLRALALVSSLGLTAVPAMAQTPVSGVIIQGTYEIEASLRDSNGHVNAYGCMILGNNGSSTVPSLYKWPGNGHFCNLDVANPQALWDIYPIYANGLVRHVIKSKYNGQCLLQGNAGQASNASVFVWGDSADKHYCGLKTAADFITNGQAAWDFSQLKAYSVSEYGYADGDIVYSGSISLQAQNQAKAFLMFSPTPASTPSSVPDVSLATFSNAPNNWQLYLFSSSMVPVPIPGSASAATPRSTF